jgi:hypothetical protein
VKIKTSYKIVAFTLAVTLLVGNLFHYPFYLFALNKIKSEMQHEILHSVSATDKTVDFNFSAQEFKNVKMNDEEICLGGNWYDIVSVAKSNDGKVNIKCLADNEESILQSWIKKVVNDNSDNSTSPSGKSGKNSISSSNDFIPVDAKHEIAAVSVSATLISNSPLAGILSGHTSRPELPPRA